MEVQMEVFQMEVGIQLPIRKPAIISFKKN